MKNIVIALLIMILACPVFAEVTTTTQTINPQVLSDLNKPISDQSIVKHPNWADWMFIAVIIIVGGLAAEEVSAHGRLNIAAE